MATGPEVLHSARRSSPSHRRWDHRWAHCCRNRWRVDSADHTQPPNSPDVNINDLGFFHSLKTDIKKICSHCTSRTEMIANVLQAFEEYPSSKLDGIWACYFNNLRSIMACDGGNDYKQAHNGGTKRKRDTGSAVDLPINLDDYDRCLRLCRG